jgi:signal transduction histidine kinase
VDISSGDEFEGLAETFNEMSDKIKKSQAMLLQSAKMSTFGQMSAGIVHEIGQPLSAISGYAELMNMGGLSEEKQQHYFAIISQQIERLKTIISKFRIFSRSSHQVVAEVDLNRILHQTQNLLEYQLKIKMVEVRWSINRALPPILGDADGLQQVFLNLLSNAVDALEKSKGTPTIEIKTYANDGSVHVEIADNGCGISKEIQQSVFDPFFTTKGEEKGTGLGLAITSSIVQKHNGTIQLISDADKGTTFILRFPIYERNEL